MFELGEAKTIFGFTLHRVQLSENLFLDEYMPFHLYKRYAVEGDRFYGNVYGFLEILCRKINRQLVEADQKLRDIFGPVVINNWWHGGKYEYRGFRTFGCGVGTELSDHYQGNASDKTFVNCDAEEVREYIKERWRDLGITIIESGVSWVHSSVAWIPDQSVLKIISG